MNLRPIAYALFVAFGRCQSANIRTHSVIRAPDLKPYQPGYCAGGVRHCDDCDTETTCKEASTTLTRDGERQSVYQYAEANVL